MSWERISGKVSALVALALLSIMISGCGGGGGAAGGGAPGVDRSTVGTQRSIEINNYTNWFNQPDPSIGNANKIDVLALRDKVCLTEEWNDVTPHALKSINPNIKVYRLYDLMCKCAWDSDWRNGSSDLSHLQTPFTKDDIDKNDWWLRDANGNIVKEDSSIWFLDVGKPGYKEAYLKAVLDRNAGKGFDGIVFDYWWPNLDWIIPNYGGTMPPKGYSSDQEWFEKAWKPFITYVCDGLHAAGYRIIGNCAGAYDTTNPRRIWQRTKIDGVVYEQWVTDFPPHTGDWLPATVIEQRINSVIADPLEVWAVDGGLESTTTDFEQKHNASIAMYYITMHQTRGTCSYYYIRNRKVQWDPLWDFNIGQPIGLASKMSGKYFWSRKFSQGVVIFNYESEETISYKLDQTYIDPVGKSFSGAISVRPHTGIILKIAS